VTATVDELVVRRVVDGAALADLQGWVDVVQSWPAGSHVWGHYAEQTAAGPVICRTENVSVCHPALARLVDGPLAALAESVMGAPPVAFKDKINYKQPGGAGFRPHQDQVAYPGARDVVSVLLAIDECTVDSGCLWIDPDVDAVLPTDDRGVVRDDVVAALSLRPAELQAGDALCIPGLAPHASDANRSAHERRVFIASFAPAAHGYTRAEYYGARDEVMRESTARDGRFRISTLADFDGVEVRATTTATCTHPRH
jgi:hypothetical protein